MIQPAPPLYRRALQAKIPSISALDTTNTTFLHVVHATSIQTLIGGFHATEVVHEYILYIHNIHRHPRTAP